MKNFNIIEIVECDYKTVKNFKIKEENRSTVVTNKKTGEEEADKQVKALKEVFTSKGFFYRPIVVNKTTMNILDGQHRWKAFIDCVEDEGLKIFTEDSKIYVEYVEIPESKSNESDIDELDFITQVNNHSKSWTKNEFLESYSKVDEGYKKFQEFLNEKPALNGKKMREGLTLLFNNSRSAEKEFTARTLSFTDEDFERADVIYDELEKVSKIINKDEVKSDGIFKEPFIKLWKSKRTKDEQLRVEELYRKIEKHKALFTVENLKSKAGRTKISDKLN